MDAFKPIDVNITPRGEVRCTFQEHRQESILWIALSGTCSHGSQGENYGEYLYQHIGLSLLQVQPLAVLVDLRALHYEYGDRILNLFQIFADVRIFDDPIITAFVLSDRNRYGLASLLQLDADNLQPPFFYDAEQAYAYLYDEYDKI